MQQAITLREPLTGPEGYATIRTSASKTTLRLWLQGNIPKAQALARLGFLVIWPGKVKTGLWLAHGVPPGCRSVNH